MQVADLQTVGKDHIPPKKVLNMENQVKGNIKDHNVLMKKNQMKIKLNLQTKRYWILHNRKHPFQIVLFLMKATFLVKLCETEFYIITDHQYIVFVIWDTFSVCLCTVYNSM